MVNDDLKDAVMSDIVLMQMVGIHVVLVHGGGPEISGMLKNRQGKQICRRHARDGWGDG